MAMVLDFEVTGEGKCVLVHALKVYEEWRYSPHVLNLGTRGGCQFHAPAAVPLEKVSPIDIQ
jgi:hypothetical protein